MWSAAPFSFAFFTAFTRASFSKKSISFLITVKVKSCAFVPVGQYLPASIIFSIITFIKCQKGLKRLLDSGDYHIAISLHHPVPEKRAEIMPAERGYSIGEIVELLKEYNWSHQRRLTFEYIVFKGINETPFHARKLLQLLKGIDCRINLIRYHAIPGVPLEGVDDEGMTQLRDYLTKNGLFTTIRASRGEDIFAACGMLSTKKQEQNILSVLPQVYLLQRSIQKPHN